MRVTALLAAVLVSTPALAAAETVVINEVMYRPWNQVNVGKYEFIELYNHGDQDVDLSGLLVTDVGDIANVCDPEPNTIHEGVYEIPANTVIAAGSYLTLWHTAVAGVTDQPGNVVYSNLQYFANLVLADTGDEVTLLDCVGSVPVILDALDYGDLSLPQTPRNVSLERIDPLSPTQDSSNWGFTLADGPPIGYDYCPGGTPGEENTLTSP
jgi:hypothetical protein